MLKDFFIKKENIFIFVIALVSIFFVVLGFLFLFFKTDSSNGPKMIPSDISEIVWDKFNSKLLDQKIEYPEYLYIREQDEESNISINITEFETTSFLDYFSNQNQISIFPSGIDIPLVYGKTKVSDFVSESEQKYQVTEYLTSDEKVWGIMFVPQPTFEKWETKGFIWVQARIRNRVESCINDKNVIIESDECDIFTGQKVIYSGEVSDQFLKTGYEIINKNYFK